VVLLRRYVERTVHEIADDPAEGIAKYSRLVFPEGYEPYVASLFTGLAFRDLPPAERQSIVDASLLLAQARDGENSGGVLAAKSQATRRISTAIGVEAAERTVSRWVSEACWPSPSSVSGGTWVPTGPRRDASKNETSCEYFSDLLDRNVACESKLEERFFRRVESSGLVQWYVEQPFPIEYTDRNGKARRYWPDALLQLVDGRWLLVEVKPLFFFIEENEQRKWSAAVGRCKERGVGFLVVDPHRSVSLAAVARIAVRDSLRSAMGRVNTRGPMIPWHAARQASIKSGSTFAEFAAWVLQTGRAACPTPRWGIIQADEGSRALDWV